MIPSIASPMDTSHVVISRESERFVNEIHDHKEELRSSNELLTELQVSGRSESYEGTCGSPSAVERKWKVTHAHSSNGGYLAVALSKMVTTMLRHYDQDERQTGGSKHWDTIRPVLMKAIAQEGARDFDEGFWLHLIHEGSQKKRLEYFKDNNGSLCYLRVIQGQSGGKPTRPELMNYTLLPYKWKEYIFHRGISWNFQSNLGSGRIWEEKRMTRLDTSESIQKRFRRRRTSF